MSVARLAGLYCYPVKSARGLSLQSAGLESTGLAHDREWLVVDAQDRFVTQREQPRLATLAVELRDDALRLQAPGSAPLTISRRADARRSVHIWRDTCEAIDAGEEAALWLSKWLGAPFRLVRFDRRQRRLSDMEWTGGVEAPNFFSDGYPLLVLGQASLDDLAARAGRYFPVERFRPNILLEGLAPYEEDRIDALQIGVARLKLVKPCMRCVIITTDQQRGERDGDEPLRTLRSYRYDARLQGVRFAQNAIVLAGAGERLTVGEPAQYSLRGQ